MSESAEKAHRFLETECQFFVLNTILWQFIEKDKNHSIEPLAVHKFPLNVITDIVHSMEVSSSPMKADI